MKLMPCILHHIFVLLIFLPVIMLVVFFSYICHDIWFYGTQTRLFPPGWYGGGTSAVPCHRYWCIKSFFRHYSLRPVIPRKISTYVYSVALLDCWGWMGLSILLILLVSAEINASLLSPLIHPWFWTMFFIYPFPVLLDHTSWLQLHCINHPYSSWQILWRFF